MILVTGSLAFDTISNFPGNFSDHILADKLHILNVSFLVSEMKKSFGGTAGNIAYNLSLLGMKAAILGVVGSDFAPYEEFLRRHEVETRYIKSINTFYTSRANGITDSKNNQIWSFYTGADALSDHLSIENISDKIDFGVVAPQSPNAMIKFCHEYKRRNIPYLFDPGMQLPHLSYRQLKIGISGALIIISNDYEMSVFLKKIEVSDVSSLGRDKIIITTVGERGANILFDNRSYDIPPARPKNTEDPAGAGDAFRAGFVAGYMRGLPLDVCGRMGSVAAVYTVEKRGTATHEYTLEQFARRYKENFGEELEL